MAIAMLVFLPLITLVFMAVQGDLSVLAHIGATVLPDYLWNSIGLVIGVGLGTLITGISSAWIVTRYEFYGRQFLQWALLIPLAMPAYITAYSYTGLLDAAGPVQQFIRAQFDLNYGEYWFPSIRSLGGAAFVMAAVLYPYVYLLARASFVEQSSSLYKTSQLLGCSSTESFFRVALPIARPAIAAGLALALMETLADYGTVSYFGVSTFTTGIFRTWFGLGEVNSAAQLSIMLLSFVALLMVLEQMSRQRARYYEPGHHNKIERIRLTPVKAMLATLITTTPVLVGFVIPSSQLVIWTIEIGPEVINDEFLQLAINSVSLAAVTALFAVALALLISYARRTNPIKLVRLSHKTVLSGYAIPGTVVAVGLLTPLSTLDQWINTISQYLFDHSTGLILSGTVFALIIGYLTRFMSVSVQTVDSGLAKVSPHMEQVAQTLGYSNGKILRRVHAPIIKTSLLTAALIVFVDVMKELPATLILRPFNFNTLAVKSFELASDELLAQAAPAALGIIAVGLLPIIVLSRAIQRD